MPFGIFTALASLSAPFRGTLFHGTLHKRVRKTNQLNTLQKAISGARQEPSGFLIRLRELAPQAATTTIRRPHRVARYVELSPSKKEFDRAAGITPGIDPAHRMSQGAFALSEDL